MNVVLFDPSLAGASGDKILSALADVLPDTKELEGRISKALLATGVLRGRVKFVGAESHSIHGKRLKVDGVKGTLRGEDMRGVMGEALCAAGLGEWGMKKVSECLELLLSAESEIHGDLHLHELGEADTFIDIVGTMVAIQILGLDGAEFYTAPIAVGAGSVESGHGILPVPAPATLAILSRAKLPVTATSRLGELTTPTGAALLASLTQGRCDPPPIRIQTFGVGVGERELGMPNITRVIISGGGPGERIKIVETNVDDISGEVVGWLIENLRDKVEDVTVLPMVTKKNRPGFTIRAVVTEDRLDAAVEAIMKGSGTLGVKVIDCQRFRAEWSAVTKSVRIGRKVYKVRYKSSRENCYMKPEYEDLRMIAAEEGLSLREVMGEALRQARQKY